MRLATLSLIGVVFLLCRAACAQDIAIADFEKASDKIAAQLESDLARDATGTIRLAFSPIKGAQSPAAAAAARVLSDVVVEMPWERSVDLDSASDFELAEFLVSRGRRN